MLNGPWSLILNLKSLYLVGNSPKFNLMFERSDYSADEAVLKKRS